MNIKLGIYMWQGLELVAYLEEDNTVTVCYYFMCRNIASAEFDFGLAIGAITKKFS